MCNYAVQIVNNFVENDANLEKRVTNGEEDLLGVLDPYFIKGLPGIELEEAQMAGLTEDSKIKEYESTDWSVEAVVNEDDLNYGG